MKSRSFSIKIPAICLLLVATSVVAVAQSSVEEGTQPDLRLSALAGLSEGQAASLNVINSSREAREMQLVFIDTGGRLLKSSVARLLPGQSMSLLLSHSELRGHGGRLQIRGAVRLVDPPEPDLVISNLEIFDEVTGRTSFGLLLPAVRGINLYFPFDTGAVRQ